MPRKLIIIVAVVVLLVAGLVHADNQTSRTNEANGAVTWEVKTHGVMFSLTQILPDQARAFYVNRGFTLQQIEPFATACVYMTVLRNDNAPGKIHFVQQQWSIVHDGQSRPPLDMDDWLAQLKQSGAKKPSLIAFRWAQFPAEQEYEPGGDWNQGMLTTGLPPGSRFDIIAKWDIDGKPYQAILKDVTCAD